MKGKKIQSSFGSIKKKNKKRENTSYNISSIEAFSSGDQERFREILISFTESATQNMLLFRQYLQEKDYESLSELSHKMLTMFRQLEANAIVELLTTLEPQNAGDDNDIEWKLIGHAVLLKMKKLLETIKTDFQIKTNE